MPLRHLPVRALAPLVAFALTAPRLVAQAAPGASTGPTAIPRSAVEGVVYDSVAARPLAGALLQLTDPANPSRGRSAAADSLGRFRFDTVPAGRYVVGFIHQLLDVLGIESPVTPIEVVGAGVVRVSLAVPGPATVRAALCGPRRGADSSAVLVGLASDAESRAALDSAQVVLTWQELQIADRALRFTPRHVAIAVQPGGRFVACGVPTDVDLTATAYAPARRSGVVELRPPAGGVQRRDFLLGVAPDTTVGDHVTPANGLAALGGVVRGPNGAPVEHARVLVIGTDAVADARADGRFAFTALPSGTYTVEARALGYVPARVIVDLSSREPATADLVLDRRVRALESVVVTGTRSTTSRRVLDFLERRQRNGFGRFLTADEITRHRPYALTEALRAVPGLRVNPGRGSTNTVRGRRGCVPEVYVDGLRIWGGANDLDLLARPHDVAGVEVYLGPGAPVQFSTPGKTCGAVVIWTK